MSESAHRLPKISIYGKLLKNKKGTAKSYGRFIEIKNNLSRKKLH